MHLKTSTSIFVLLGIGSLLPLWFLNWASSAQAAALAQPAAPLAGSLSCNGGAITFESGLPADWSVVDASSGGAGIDWVTTADGPCPGGNLTNGSGLAACASSLTGSGSPAYDTSLETNTFALDGITAATLSVAGYYDDRNAGSNDRFEVDVWNGAAWVNELSWDEDHTPSQFNMDFSLNLLPYAGQEELRLRFRYFGDGNDGRAQIDNVALSCAFAPQIVPQPAAITTVLPANATVTESLVISNAGLGALTWQLVEAVSPAAPAAPAAAPLNLELNAGGRWTEGSPAALDAQGELFTPPPPPRFRTLAPLAPQLVNDGSFENGPPPASAWTETSSTTCEWIGNFTAAWGVPAYDGTFDYWGGGYCGDTYERSSSSVTQTLTIPAETSLLAFHYIHYRPSADDPVANDFAYVTIDGSEIWSLTSIQAANNYPNWELATIDISAYAGQTVELGFGFTSNADGNVNLTGNIRYDAITFLDESTCEFPSNISWLSVAPGQGTTPALGSTPLEVLFNTAGLASGTYTATLCIDSNDPVTPQLTVPVEMTVCGPPAAVQELLLSKAGSDAQLNWSSTGNQFEVWWDGDQPYFTPGQVCQGGGNCAATADQAFTDGGVIGDPAQNRFYGVRGLNRCGGNPLVSPLSTRKGVFNFAITPGN